MSQVAFKTNFSSAAMEQIQKQRGESITKTTQDSSPSSGGSQSFLDHLKEGIMEVNESHRTADKLASQVATGRDENLHEAMLAMTQTELSFNFMVQVRNKALEAYQEIMRMPV